MDVNDWPDCAIEGCTNKCCLRLKSRFCWPHTPGADPKEVRDSLAAEIAAEVLAGPEYPADYVRVQ